LFGRIFRAQSVILLWLAYRIGVVKQCCQMVWQNTIFCKNGVNMLVCMAVGKIFSKGALVDFFQKFS